MPEIEFHFDFGSPNAYLAHRILPGVVARTGAVVRYVPVLIGGVFKATNNSGPLVAYKDIPAKMAYMRVEMRRFLTRHGITDWTMNPFFPVNTLTVMRGAVAAQQDGDFARYVDVIFHHTWCEPKKMDDPAIIQAVLDANGFDGARLLDRAQDPAVKHQLVHNTEDSVARGAFGSPTFFVGKEMFFGKDQVRDVEEEVARTAGKVEEEVVRTA